MTRLLVPSVSLLGVLLATACGDSKSNESPSLDGDAGVDAGPVTSPVDDDNNEDDDSDNGGPADDSADDDGDDSADDDDDDVPNPGDDTADDLPDDDTAIFEDDEPTIPENSGLWSSPETWPGGAIPQAGDDVLIPNGQDIILDISPPSLGGLSIEGSLIFDETDLELTAEWIAVLGRLQVGTEARPFPAQATITLTGNDPEENVMGMGTRGILVMGGTLDLHGQVPTPTWTKLAESSPAGASELTLLQEVNWSEGDQVVVAPTDFYRVGRTERSVVGAVEANRIMLQAPIQQPRWGILQYIEENGVTLTETHALTDKVIDERAEVGNLTRNIVIQGADDALWNEQEFGAHTMIMNPGEAFIEGVEFRRVGQAGRLARYPIHWHLWSYVGGSEVGDVAGQYVRGSTIWSSGQRCVVIHGTNGATISNNICYDIRGHAMFLEDAVERRNVFDGNLVLHVHRPRPEVLLLRHEDLSSRGGPSGFWLTNPDNTIRGNAVADSEGVGFWLAYPDHTLGLNQEVPLDPQRMEFGVFEDNVTHSNQRLGLLLDTVPINEEGDVQDALYAPRRMDPETSEYVHAPFTISRVVAYKHEQGTGGAALWNRARAATYTDFVVADHTGEAFSGASTSCAITNALVVGTTLNNANLPIYDTAPQGAASYHSECQISDNLFVNLPAVAGRDSGAFATNDYYITPVDKGLVNNPNNLFINSHTGFRQPSPNTFAVGEGRENYALAGALWDPYGYWGPAGNYWVYDMPFFTDGTECVETNEPVHGNDMSCAGPYYGVMTFQLDGESNAGDALTRPLEVTRVDNDTTWFVDDGDCTQFLGAMRHVAVVKGGSYVIDFPAARTPADLRDGTPGDQRTCDAMSSAPPLPHAVHFVVSNLFEGDDEVFLAVPFDPETRPSGYISAWPNSAEVTTWDSWNAWNAGDPNWQDQFRGEFWRPLVEVASLDALRASDQTAFWHDTATGHVWLRVARMGMAVYDSDPVSALYGALHVELISQ